jgi:hypothetical protein
METQRTGLAKFNNRFGKLGFVPQMAETTAEPAYQPVKRFTAPAQPEVAMTAAPTEAEPVRPKRVTPSKMAVVKSLHEEDVLRVILSVPGGLSEEDIATRLKKQKFNLLPGQLATMLRSLEEKRRIIHAGRTDREVWRRRV